MRILFLAHRFPYPPTFGSRVRAFNVIKHLARSHEVTLISLVRSAAEAQAATGMARHCHDFQVIAVRRWAQVMKLLLATPTSLTASEAYFHSRRLRRLIERLLGARSFDAVFVNASSVGRYVEHARGLVKLIDFCDVDSRKWLDYASFKPWPLSAGYRWEAMRLAAVERRLARHFEAVAVATEAEAASLRTLGVTRHIDVFPNGVDLEYFQPADTPFDADLITFLGRMDYYPNAQCMARFCHEVLPRLQRARPRLRLQLVGADPTAAVRRLGRLPGVTVTGTVPDVRPYLWRSALTVAPLEIARGTQNKILESMAMGLPAVCSPIAAAGIEALPGEHLLVAERPEQWCEQILRVSADPALRQRLGTAARAHVEARYTWSCSMQRVDRMLERCLEASPEHHGETGHRSPVEPG